MDPKQIKNQQVSVSKEDSHTAESLVKGKSILKYSYMMLACPYTSPPYSYMYCIAIHRETKNYPAKGFMF